MSPGCINHSPHLLKRPSSSILAALGTIVAATNPANAKSAPPPFLCPSLHTGTTPEPEPLPAPTLASRSPHRPGLGRRDLPDKYEIQNGVWRRVNVWSLYGSTVCAVRPVLLSLPAHRFSSFFSCRTVIRITRLRRQRSTRQYPLCPATPPATISGIVYRQAGNLQSRLAPHGAPSS